MNINQQLGNVSDSEIHQSFDGMTKDEILEQLKIMWPVEAKEDTDGNEELANAIYKFCNS